MLLHAFRDQFQPVFFAALREKTQAAAALVPDAFVANLVQYPEQVAGGDGKRVRPYLVWLLANAGNDPAFIRLTSALEFFHAFALVHDDIIDRGTLRHGVPTVHTYAESRMKAASRIGNISHVAAGQAILVGDLLFQWAREIFHEGEALFLGDRFHTARRYFDTMANEVMIGQMVDVDISTRPEVTMELIRTKMQLKTASYTFVRPMQIGLAFAGMDTDTPWVTQFGTSLGVAFQMQDDYTDLTATNVEAGKTVFSDLRTHQPTVLTQYIVENGTDAQRAELARLMGAALTDADRERVMRLFTESGSLAFGEAEVARLLEQAEAALPAAPEPVRVPFAELIQSVRQRKS